MDNNYIVEYYFDEKYHKEDTNTTFRYPFEVPNDAEIIEVFIEDRQAEKPKHHKDTRPDPVAVGIAYQGMVRSWNCCHKRHLFLAEEYGMPGSIPGKIEGGEWELLIFPRTKNEITEVQMLVTVRITRKHYRYVKGDTHLHTDHSDGTITIDQVVEKCKAAGLDYAFITDHNISSSNYSLPKDKGILIIPGVEYGVEAGHMNILGELTAVQDFTWDPAYTCYERTLDMVKGTKSGIGMNHPFCNDSPWNLDMGMDFDWVEVWNGMWRPVNDKGIRWWHEELLKGRRLTAIGGSDAHHGEDPVIKHGVPCTHAYVRELTGDAVVEAYKAGHVYVTWIPQGPSMHMHTEHDIMGDITEDREVYIDIENLEAGDLVYVITDQGEEEFAVEGTAFHHTFVRQDERFVRVQAKRKINANALVEFLDYETWGTILLSNPIYFA